ncbi:MAG: DUF362 domain-containing protein [Spirochaetes bacterium]|nr:DUF362 domain-containing protein [Spirochaetota bacterium]
MKKVPDRGDNRVIIRKCGSYDREKICRIVKEGMRELGYAPRGRVCVKPNVVFAGDPEKFGVAAYTSPELVAGSIMGIAGEGVKRIEVGENTAVGFPTRWCYKNAGYYKTVREVRKRLAPRLGIYCIDEDRRVEVSMGGIVHNTFMVSEKMMKADSLVYLPKLKCHCVATMTGAVKLNIGICSDDSRSIRHDYMLHDKIVDLLAVGYPDFIVMDAIDVGVGNEGFPDPAHLGVVIMGRNPVAVDMVGARLLGFDVADVPYLKRAVERAYLPSRIEDIKLTGDIRTLSGLDSRSRNIDKKSDQFTRWHDIPKELRRLESPMRFFWGRRESSRIARGKKHADPLLPEKCNTGCLMGVKMFLSFLEHYAGPEKFKKAKPSVFVVGCLDGEIDAEGGDVIMVGSCASAPVRNARRIIRLDQCFVTTSYLTMRIGGRIGMPNPLADPRFLLPLLYNYFIASVMKVISFRYLQDAYNFIKKNWMKKI